MIKSIIKKYWVEILVLLGVIAIVAPLTHYLTEHFIENKLVKWPLIVLISALAEIPAHKLLVPKLQIMTYRKFLFRDLSQDFEKMEKAFNSKILKLYRDKYIDQNSNWATLQTKLQLIFKRSASEIPENPSRDLIDSFKNDIDRHKPSYIIATNTSPLSLWFHHIITTFFIAQTKDLSVQKEGLSRITRYYLLKDSELLNGIVHSDPYVFDYWNAANEIHRIAGKELYVLYKNDYDFHFPINTKGEVEDKLLIYLDGIADNSKIKFIRSIQVDADGTPHSREITGNFDDFYKFLTAIKYDLKRSTSVTTHEQFKSNTMEIKKSLASFRVVSWRVY